MCSPAIAAGVMGGISMIQSTLTILQANQQAGIEMEAANRAAAADYATIAAQRTEIAQASASESMDVAREMLRKRATLRVAQGESGVSGVTPIRELANVRLQKAEALGRIEANTESALLQSKREEDKVRATRESRLSAAKGIGGWAAALQIGASTASGALQGYSVGKGIWPKKP